ncbi:MAG TPA: hypothetical protein VE973_02260 [Candidatus Limnocylindria bacterium]|nr:hypothetical protein [Candidatus Limnocylindria bacterium]
MSEFREYQPDVIEIESFSYICDPTINEKEGTILLDFHNYTAPFEKLTKEEDLRVGSKVALFPEGRSDDVVPDYPNCEVLEVDEQNFIIKLKTR